MRSLLLSSRCTGISLTRAFRGGTRSVVLIQKSFSTSTSERNRNDPSQIKEDHAHCVNLVRERDREGYFCGLLMPSAAQKAYFAVRAFNVELASIKDGHNLRRSGQRDSAATLVLQIRMQWWRDALHEIYDNSNGDTASTSTNITKRNATDPILSNLSIASWHSPVVRALDVANRECNLTRRFLERLIDSRETDLDVNQYKSMADAVAYAEESVSSLLYLSLECTGVREDEADIVASHAGVGIGLATALRATPFRLVHGEVPIPSELLHPKFAYNELLNFQEDEFTLSEQDAAMFRQAVQHMAEEATGHLAQARELQGKVPKHARACILPVIPALVFLSKLQEVDHNLFDSKLQVSEQARLKLLLLLGRTWLTGIF
jgi:NADH dehydrogenase [ubiquinone] 1 alpha subcomplex assembly factor 6